MSNLRRLGIAVLFVVVSWFGLTALHRHLDPNTHKTAEQREDARWIATSKYWLDRTACRYMGICGLAHYHPDPATISWKKRRIHKKSQSPLKEEYDGTSTDSYGWEDVNKMRPEDWEGDARVLKDVPQFVLDHAPLIHLYSGEQFWPSDIAEHLMHTSPHRNHTAMKFNKTRHGLRNLDELNSLAKGSALFMKSNDDVEERPDWLGSAYNKPIPYPDDVDDDEDEEFYEHREFMELPDSEDKDTWYDPYREKAPKSANPLSSSFRSQSPRSRRGHVSKRNPTLANPGGYSPAPVILVLVDKGNGILDAFWFYFYSYNLGTTVLNIRFGNHIGDWEHSLIRFHNGVPKAVFFSAHSGGIAYSYGAVEKGKGKGREGRPVLYSAKGSHAMYATPGKHPYVLPFGLLADVTDKGPLWDPALNYLAYHFNTSITHNADAKFIHSSTITPTKEEMADILQPAGDNPNAPTGWWWYTGHWGDKFYELGDWRQWRFVGQYHYVNGPYGPKFKNLGRSRVCQSRGSCTIQTDLIGDGKRSWLGKRAIGKRGLSG